MKLPSSILAFKLLQKAKISEEEKMLVMTGMNYADKGTLYEQPKTSLKTFKGEMVGGDKDVNTAIKLEPAFLAQHEQLVI